MAEKNSLWKNIRKKAEQNRRTGAKPKKPTAEMLKQERKIKAKKYPDGGPVNTLEGDLISKVIMNRNRDKDFVQRAYAVGEYPESNMFVQPDVNEFGQKNSHLMGWGEDESGQAYMYPEVMNPNNEAIKVPNQYADYISSTGYKKATGIPYAHGGPTKSLVQPPVLLDDNIIYPTDNPYIPGVNKDILDSEYDSYMRWREGFINNQGMTPEEYYQTYPSRQEYDRQNFDPANLYNSVSLAQGGYVDGDDDKLKPKYVAERSTTATKNMPALGTKPYNLKPGDNPGKDSLVDDIVEIFDPTGLSSWDDALAEDANILDYISVVPSFGIVGKGLKLMKSPRTGLNAYHVLKASQAEDLMQRSDNKATGGYMYPDGGGTIKPKTIYTDDKNDPRLKAYNDSLSLYTNSQPKVNNYLNFIKNNNLLSDVYTPISDERIRPLRGHSIIMQQNLNGEFLVDKNRRPTNLTRQDLINAGIDKNTATYGVHEYKKPVQPVVYKPRPILPQVDRLEPKQYNQSQQLKLSGNTPELLPVNHNYEPEGHYRVIRPHTYGEPQYQVWTPGNKWQNVTQEEYDKVSGNKYLTEYKNGGHINPYMYYAGGPMQYSNGGKVWKHIGAGAYALGEGMLDTITMGATDQLTDKGFEWLTKVGNKNLDLSDPKNAKFFKTQQQIKGYGNLGGAATAAVLTGNVQGAIGQGAKGLNTAFQASDWASDDFKKWSQGISGVAGMAAGFAGGLNSDSFNAAAKAGTGIAGFGQKAGKIGSFGNQVTGMFGGNQQPLWQQGEQRQELLNSPEYLAMKEKQNQAYVNQGLSFAANGGPVNNNLLTLQTGSMRKNINNYRRKYKEGGQVDVNDKLTQFGLHKIQNGGKHWQNPKKGVIVGNASVEEDEVLKFAEGGSVNLSNAEYVYPDTVNDEFTLPMYKPNESLTDFELDKDGNPIPLDMTPAEFLIKEGTKGSPFRKINTLAKIRMNNAEAITRKARDLGMAINEQNQQNQQMMVEGALQYAAAGGKLNKDLEEILSNDIQSYVEADNYYAYGGYLPKDKRFNMPNSYAKGGSIHIKKSKRGTFTAAAKKHGKSVQEFARQVLANKGNYSSAMVKKANFARNAAKWHHAEGGPMVSNIKQPFEVAAQNRGGMMMNYAMGGNMYAMGGPGDELNPEQLKAQGYVEYDNYFYNPITGQYVDKPSDTDKFYQQNLEKYMSTPDFKFATGYIKPAEMFLGYVDSPLQSNGIRQGSPLIGGDLEEGKSTGLDELRFFDYNDAPQEQKFPILNADGSINTTPEDYLNLRSETGGRDYDVKNFNKVYNQVMSTRDKVRRAYQNKSPYLDSIVSKPATPIQPIERMQSRNLQQLPTNNTPLSIINNYPESSYRPATLTEEEQNMLNRMSNTVGFIPSDVIVGKLGLRETSDKTGSNEIGPVNTSTIPRENPLTLNMESPQPKPYSNRWSLNPQPESLMTDENGNVIAYDSAAQYFAYKPEAPPTKVNQPKQPNEGLTGLDYASMIGQAAAGFHQLGLGLKGGDPVNYQRITAEKIDPTVAIALAAEEGRRAQDSAAYLMRQSAPTSGSYMNNLRNLSLQSGKQRGLQSAGLRYQADVANTQMQNQVNAQNAQIAMQEQIDRLQEKDAARTNVTEGLSGVGSSTANMIRDYKTNQINQMIAKNIGTNDWRFDAVTNEIVFRRDGKEVRLPAETVTGTNAVNIGTGQMQQSQNLPFDPNFKFKRTNKYLKP